MTEPRNILIVRTDRIGDVILSLPLAEIIKRHYPTCKVSFLIREYTKDILFNYPFIDEVIMLKEENGEVLIKENKASLKKFNFDFSIVVYPTFKIAWLIYLADIPFRIGTGYRWYSFLFNKKIYVHRKYAEKHELEFNVELLKAVRINEQITTGNVHFNIRISVQSEQKIENILKDNGINNEDFIVIVHPGSSGSAVDLPADKFKEIVQYLSINEKIKIVITGNSKEKKLCEALKINDKILNFAGMFSLSELIALINKANIMIANSTGPLHIAAALGKHVIGFYPKIPAASAKRWGPYTKKGKVFEPEIDCQNCTREQCQKLDCMRSINVNEVVKEVEKIYNLSQQNGAANNA
jgi:lipopolysaccharide heptosyltransferase III